MITVKTLTVIAVKQLDLKQSKSSISITNEELEDTKKYLPEIAIKALRCRGYEGPCDQLTFQQIKDINEIYTGSLAGCTQEDLLYLVHRFQDRKALKSRFEEYFESFFFGPLSMIVERRSVTYSRHVHELSKNQADIVSHCYFYSPHLRWTKILILLIHRDGSASFFGDSGVGIIPLNLSFPVLTASITPNGMCAILSTPTGLTYSLCLYNVSIPPSLEGLLFHNPKLNPLNKQGKTCAVTLHKCLCGYNYREELSNYYTKEDVCYIYTLGNQLGEILIFKVDKNQEPIFQYWKTVTVPWIGVRCIYSCNSRIILVALDDGRLVSLEISDNGDLSPNDNALIENCKVSDIEYYGLKVYVKTSNRNITVILPKVGSKISIEE
ncbi:Hypothetical protein HVR_LOCUS264 [uncultured virus]|nr:Hypothetical protein HVR_LOCUS264 [uncultured virus]